MLTSGNGYKSDCHGGKNKTIICITRKSISAFNSIKIIFKQIMYRVMQCIAENCTFSTSIKIHPEILYKEVFIVNKV